MFYHTPIRRITSTHGATRSICTQNRTGFTLIEMVISITIFMIFVSIVTSSFSTLIRANRIANETQKIYFAVRGIFDSFATAVRNGTIDYSTECIPTHAEQKICVMGNDGVHREMYTWNNEEKKLTVQQQARADIDSVWSILSQPQRMNDESLPLDNVVLSIFPSKNPYDRANAYDATVQWQPALTVSMKIKDSVLRATYSSRTYGQHPLYAGN